LSPEALVEQLLDRIRRENPKLNAYYEVFWEEAPRAAAQAAKELKSGRDPRSSSRHPDRGKGPLRHQRQHHDGRRP
jgi:hypothetical protein